MLSMIAVVSPFLPTLDPPRGPADQSTVDYEPNELGDQDKSAEYFTYSAALFSGHGKSSPE